MALPSVRMEAHHASYPSLLLSDGSTVTITNGRCNVPWQRVREMLDKGFTITDPAIKYPPAKGAMCPPTPLTPVAQPNNAAPAPYYTWPRDPVPLTRVDPPAVPSVGGAADMLPRRALGPLPGSTAYAPYAVVNLPDGTTINAPYPGSNYIEIPEKHIAYFKTQGWLLLSENM